MESLRAAKNKPQASETITISAADPLNLVGIIIPGERVSTMSSKFISITDGAIVKHD